MINDKPTNRETSFERRGAVLARSTLADTQAQAAETCAWHGSTARVRDRLIRLPEVLYLTGLSRSTLYEKIGHGKFPVQIPLGANMVAWYESQVFAWIDNPR